MRNRNRDKGLSEIKGVKSKYRNWENRCRNQNRSNTNQIKNCDSTTADGKRIELTKSGRCPVCNFLVGYKYTFCGS